MWSKEITRTLELHAYKIYFRAASLPQLVDYVTLDLWIVSLSPALDVEIS